MMSRDPREERLNWGLDWSDYLTSQRDFIVGRLEEHLDSDQVAFEEQEELGQATVARAHAVLRFSPHLYEDCKNDNAQAWFTLLPSPSLGNGSWGSSLTTPSMLYLRFTHLGLMI